MNPFARQLLYGAPSLIKRLALVQLFKATAAAFECEMPRLRGLTREECLLEYARFTSACAEDALRRETGLAELHERLYRNAYRLGRTTGRILGAHSTADVMELGRFLYGILDIDFDGDRHGDITIGRCYFSSCYSPAICEVMSSMDAGLLAGLAGRGNLVFVERITEGRPCCRARFT